MQKRQSLLSYGFTLIELLIVVAIIAILAAIAVPNFLEAQTRSKVSRAKADLRTMATAIEAYSVDWNMPPPGQEARNSTAAPGAVGQQWPNIGGPNKNVVAQACLTTPIAYITHILPDPFKTRGQWQPNSQTQISNTGARYFWYDESVIPSRYFLNKNLPNNPYCKLNGAGYIWGMYSIGPSRNSSGQVNFLLLGTLPNPTDPDVVYYCYDPTNGTVSWGWIVRTNKGQFTVPRS